MTHKHERGYGKKEIYFFSPFFSPSVQNMLRRQEELENGTAWSNSSESSDDSSSPQLSQGLRHAQKNLVQPEVQASAPAIDISFAPRQSSTSTPTRLANQKEEDEEEEEEQDEALRATTIAATPEPAGTATVPNGHARYSRSLSHISESSVDAALNEKIAGESLEPGVVLDTPLRAAPCSFNPEPQADHCTVDLVTLSSSSSDTTAPVAQECSDSAPKYEEPTTRPQSESCTNSEEDSTCVSVHPEASVQQSNALTPRTDSIEKTQDTRDLPKTHTVSVQDKTSGTEVDSWPGDVGKMEDTEAKDSGLDKALRALLSSLDDYRGQFPELQMLEQELRLLEEALTVS